MNLGELRTLLDDISEVHDDDPVMTMSPSGWLVLADMHLDEDRLLLMWGPLT